MFQVYIKAYIYVCMYVCVYIYIYTYTHTYIYISEYIVSVCASSLSHVWFFATLWTLAQQALLSMGSSRQEYWSGLPCTLPGDPSDLGIKPASPVSPALQVNCLPPGFITPWAIREACICIYILFHILFHYKVLQDTENRSLSYILGSCHLYVLYKAVCIC